MCMLTTPHNMDLPPIQEILEEISDNGPRPSQETLDCSEHEDLSDDYAKLKEIMLQVLQEMQDDKALVPLHNQIEKCQGKVKALCGKLQFVMLCKPKDGLKNTPSLQEKAWGKFHQSLVDNLNDITTVTQNTQLSSFLCLRLFERLLAPPPEMESTAAPSQEYSQDELDIISYISGSVVSKVKRFSRRLQIKEQEQYKEVIKYLSANEESGSENTAMIDSLDRGGLTRVKPQVFHMFIAMEDIFVSMFNNATVFSVDEYMKKCGEHDDILCGYYETVYDSDAPDFIKEYIVKKMIHIYFTVRVHQKCRVFMDKVREKTRASKKEKALRQKLKK